MRSTTVISLLVASWALLSREEIFSCGWFELTLFETRITSCSCRAGYGKALFDGGMQDSNSADFHSSFLIPCLFLVRLPTLTLRPNRGCKAWLTS